jgi:uncharacterized protein (DUF362 family)
MYKVGIKKIEKDIYESLGSALDLIGGIERFVKRKDKVLIKPNAFINREEKGFVSDTRVTISLARLCKEQGAEVYIGERTPIVYKWYPKDDLKDIAEVISLDDVQNEIKVLPNAKVIKTAVPIPKIVEECDVFINVPGLRYHALTLLSNGMKNLMGIMPKETTLLIHLSGLDDAIVDLNEFRKSDLIVSTAINTLIGNFPVEGYGIDSNTLIVGYNVVAVDTVCAKILDLEISEIRHLVLANRRGLGPIDLSQIEILGDSIESLEWRRNLEKPIIDFEPYKDKINIIYPSNSCLGCKRAIASGISSIFKENKNLNLNYITIVAGPVENLDNFKLTEKIILFGNCTYPYRDRGVYIQGCPPRANFAKQGVKELM